MFFAPQLRQNIPWRRPSAPSVYPAMGGETSGVTEIVTDIRWKRNRLFSKRSSRVKPWCAALLSGLCNIRWLFQTSSMNGRCSARSLEQFMSKHPVLHYMSLKCSVSSVSNTNLTSFTLLITEWRSKEWGDILYTYIYTTVSETLPIVSSLWKLPLTCDSAVKYTL